MLTKQGLLEYFGLQPRNTKPELLVFCPQISERFRYTCLFICHHVLKINVHITEQESEFAAWPKAKLRYSEQEYRDDLWIKASGLLNETGIAEKIPEFTQHHGGAYLYWQAEQQASALPLDIFSAVFFLISRYEEWQQVKTDVHGRFEAQQSVLVKNNLHRSPLIEQWVAELAKAIKTRYPEVNIPVSPFRVMSTIDIDNLYAYKHKGFIRTLGAMGKDLLKRDSANFNERLAVLFGKKADPFDIYDSVSDFCFEQQIPLLYFFLFRTGTRYDRTVDPASPAFKSVFERIARHYATMGIHPSYHASDQPTLLSKELTALRESSGKDIRFSRQHFLRFNIRSTPTDLMANGIDVDFSMGFASEQGLRAGTSIPFYYYDFSKEQSSDLLLVPFCTMDGVYTIYHGIDAEKALVSMLNMATSIASLGGNFISVFHERSFSDHLYPGFGSLYKKLHLSLKAL